MLSNCWQLLRDDLDAVVHTRFLSGRITKKRYQIIVAYCKRYNNRNAAPYGVSPNGYAYNCGHDWDCCGCLITSRINMSAAKDEILLVLQSNYNY